MPEGFGERIKRGRQALGLTQGQAAARIGVSQSALSHWERGQGEPREEKRLAAERLIREAERAAHPGGEEDAATDGSDGLDLRIKRARLSSGLTQAEVAARIGVTPRTVSNWERGESTPQARYVEQLEQFLGNVTPVGGEDPSSDDGPSPFGAWVSRVRTEKGLTRTELAHRADVSQMTVYNLETGRISNPHEKTRARLTSALGESAPQDAVDATEREATIEGIGALVDFDPHDPQDCPEGSGVYVFYDISERPIYVGESGNMARRIRDHYEKFWFRAPIVQRGAYITVTNASLRSQIERVLIRFLKSNAVINRQHVER